MPLFIQEAVNLFVGDDGPNNSKHLVLEGLKLPTLEEIAQKHYAGGAIGEIEVGGLGLKALQSTFKIKGYDPQIMSQFGLGTRANMPFTIYGAIRDKKGNSYKELKAVLHGRLAKVEVDDMKRGELIGADHMIHEIVHYELFWDKAEKYYYDYFTSEWRVDGASQNAAIRNILRIPGNA